MGWCGWIWIYPLFSSWNDKGYLLSKISGVAGIGLVVWWLASWKILPFTLPAVLGVTCGLTVIGAGILYRRREKLSLPILTIICEEFLFLALLTFWSWIKAHEPTINGLEKFMDYGFTQSILRSTYFPPADMWYSGGTINYYYFGHYLLALMTKISGVGLPYTFNLMLATLFSLAFSMAFSISTQLFALTLPLRKAVIGAMLTATLLSLGGNLHTIYAFTQGYAGEVPEPFWKIWSDIKDPTSLRNGWKAYWYPNATRFIPFTIHEFPSYSFVVSDIHGHVLSIPLALLAIGLLVHIHGLPDKRSYLAHYGVYGVVSGTAFMTNALDGPIYIGLQILLTLFPAAMSDWKSETWWRDKTKKLVLMLMAFILTVLPFMLHFSSFVSGIGVNCPPVPLWNRSVGPFLFEDGEKCQKSALWMMGLLWGFFVFGILGLRVIQGERADHKARRMFGLWALFCAGLIIFPEFFYFKDIYPLHFRSNTMFKLGYQVFMLMSLLTGYVIAHAWLHVRRYFLYCLVSLPLLLLVLIYPYFAVRSYFGELKIYKGLNGVAWITERYPEDAAVIDWFFTHLSDQSQPVILEAQGDSYTDFERISTFTGLPTVAGWTVHEWLWRGYDTISGRNEDVRLIYEGENEEEVRNLLQKYQIQYIVIGGMERERYPRLNIPLLQKVAPSVFHDRSTMILKVY